MRKSVYQFGFFLFTRYLFFR